MEITIDELYRQIGRTFREHGADKVVLLKAKKMKRPAENTEREKEYFLEVAADGWFDKKKLQQKCSQLWPEVEMNILDLNEDENLGLVDEVMEDGILL